MKRMLAALLVGASVFSLAFAAAAALNVDASVIQSGGDVDVTCQTGQVTIGYETLVSGHGEFAVSGIKFSGLEETCEGMTVAVSLLAGPPVSPGSGVTQIGFIGGVLPADLSSGNFTLNSSNATFTSGFPVAASAIGDVQVLIKSGDL
jgi:opacity protein-like surface antigen